MTDRIADDYASIAQRMNQIEKDRHVAKFQLPEGVCIIVYGSKSHRQFTEASMTSFTMCLLLRGISLTMVRAADKTDATAVFEHLRQYFPSLRPKSRLEAVLSEADSLRLEDIVTRLSAS